jgi:hypothetical protein
MSRRGTEALYRHANIWKYFNIIASDNSIGAEAVGSLREVTILGNTLTVTSPVAE